MKDLLQLLLETELLLRKSHWNIVGPRFEPLHGVFGGLYDKVAVDSDIVAEKIRQDGEKVTVTEVECKYNVKTDNEMLSATLAHFKEIQKEVNTLSKLAERQGDYGAIDLLGKMSNEYSKDIWKLTSFLQ